MVWECEGLMWKHDNCIQQTNHDGLCGYIKPVIVSSIEYLMLQLNIPRSAFLNPAGIKTTARDIGCWCYVDGLTYTQTKNPCRVGGGV